MTFKYINPGYGDLFDYNHTQTLTNTTYAPTNGVCIPSCEAADRIANNSNELWIAFDVYIRRQDSSSSKTINTCTSTITDRNHLTGIVTHRGSYDDTYFSFVVNNTEVGNTQSQITLNNNSLHHVVLHVKMSAVDGVLSCYIDKQPIFTYNGVTHTTFGNVCIESDDYAYISNIIVSDSDISEESVIAVPLINTTGTFDGIKDNISEATAVGQTLTNTVNSGTFTSQLQTLTTSKYITGIAIAAREMRYDETNINSMKLTIKNGDNDLFSSTKKISMSNTIVPQCYVGQIPIEDLPKLTLTLTATKS